MHLSMQKAMQRCNRHRPAAILDPTRRIIFEEADTEGSHEATCNTNERTRLSQGGNDRRYACEGKDLKQACPQPRDVATHHESVKTTAQQIRTQAIIKALAWPCGMGEYNGALAIGNGSWVGF